MKLTDANIVERYDKDVIQKICERFSLENSKNNNFWNCAVIQESQLFDAVIVCGYKNKSMPNFLNLLSWTVFVPIFTSDISGNISSIYKNVITLQKKYDKSYLNLLDEDTYRDDCVFVSEIEKNTLSYINEHRPDIDLNKERLNYIEVSDYDTFVKRWSNVWAKNASYKK